MKCNNGNQICYNCKNIDKNIDKNNVKNNGKNICMNNFKNGVNILQNSESNFM